MTKKPTLSHHPMVEIAPPISPRSGTEGTPRKLEIDGDRVRNGLAQLVLTLVKLLHELLERQAIRRMDSGSLTDEEIERLGVTLMRQAEELEKLREVFGLKDEDLNFNLGPLGRLL
ncbi:MAG: gas vesicle protein K [Methylococcaceae bacterium]